uniref:dihydrofolate reductase n=1 Tax=Candidatus Limisoma sp. TaxID=3076476 RepID=UPI004024A8A3
MKNLSIIAAVAKGGAIGKNGGLLCHISADLQRFKALTTGHTIVMGRRTFDSLPKGPWPSGGTNVSPRPPPFTA